MDPRWAGSRFTVREKKWTIGRQYYVLDEAGKPLAFCRQKAFRLREDIRFYADETQAVELFRMQTAKILDFNANFEIVDSATGAVVGAVGRRGWKSILRDHWRILDAQGQVVGTMREHGGFLSVARRFVGLLQMVPHRYELLLGPEGQERSVGEIRERFQLFGDTYDVSFAPGSLDPRVAVALVVCADGLEGQ